MVDSKKRPQKRAATNAATSLSASDTVLAAPPAKKANVPKKVVIHTPNMDEVVDNLRAECAENTNITDTAYLVNIVSLAKLLILQLESIIKTK